MANTKQLKFGLQLPRVSDVLFTFSSVLQREKTVIKGYLMCLHFEVGIGIGILIIKVLGLSSWTLNASPFGHNSQHYLSLMQIKISSIKIIKYDGQHYMIH